MPSPSTPSYGSATPHPHLPSLHLPAPTARTLRTLFFATTPPSPISYLLLKPTPPTLSIQLSPHPTPLPLFHHPPPAHPSNTLLLHLFTLSATATPQGFRFCSVIPDVDISTGEETALDKIPILLERTPLHLLLSASACTEKYGFVTQLGGYYRPVSKTNLRKYDKVAGVWTAGGDSGHALLHLAKLLQVRSNVRLSGTRSQVAADNTVVVFRYGPGGGVWVTDVRMRIGKLRKWVCVVPWGGGTAVFMKIAGGRGKSRRRVSPRLVSPRPVQPLHLDREGGEGQSELSTTIVEERDGEGSEKESETAELDNMTELLSAKMEELSFMREADERVSFENVETQIPLRPNEAKDGVTKYQQDDSLRIPELSFTPNTATTSSDNARHATAQNPLPPSSSHIPLPLETLIHVDLDDYDQSDTIDTTDDRSDTDEQVMDALCQQYLNTSWSNTVQKQLDKLTNP